MSDDRVELVLQAVAALRGDVAGVAGRTETIAGRLDHIEAAQAHGFASLQDDVAGLARRLENVEALQLQERTELLGALAIARSDLLAELAKVRGELMARMDRQQDAASQARDEIMVKFGHAEAIQRVTDATRDEVRALNNLVSLMQRQIVNLQNAVRGLQGEA